MPIEISRAIEVISEDGRESGEGTWEEYLAAIQLGREALKFKASWRKGIYFPADYLLPGETAE